MKIIIVLCATALFIFESYNIIFRKRIFMRGMKPIYLNQNPQIFWLNVIGFIIGLPFSLFLIFYVVPSINNLFK